MPNGFYGTRAEWERLTAPLLKLDAALEDFSAQHRIPLAKNPRNWPSRDLRWSDSLDRLIQISLEDAATLTWTMGVCATEDRADGRYWKRAHILNNVTIDTLEAGISLLLAEAFGTVAGWASADLEKA